MMEAPSPRLHVLFVSFILLWEELGGAPKATGNEIMSWTKDCGATEQELPIDHMAVGGFRGVLGTSLECL